MTKTKKWELKEDDRIKFTREMAEEQEKQGIFEALDNGAIELNDEFLNRFVGEKVKEILIQLSQEDRAFHLMDSINEKDSFFNGSLTTNCDNDIWINISEIEVQFEGGEKDYFADLNDWTIKEDFAYLYIGYGLTINVNVDKLQKDIKEWYSD